jgi:serine/threonine protein kinase
MKTVERDANDFELKSLIASGGEGDVYIANDKSLMINKIIKVNRETHPGIGSEYDIMRRLHHPNILEIEDVFHLDNDKNKSLCYSLPLMRNGDLLELSLLKYINPFTEIDLGMILT